MIRYSFFSFLSGLLFALGLSVSGMTEPGKVIGFLNITRSWDPSLVFVMGGAVITYFILFRLIHKRSAPLFALQFSIPERKDIDLPLLGGAVLFGIGWGIGGFCPGPAVASIFTGKPNVLLFAGSSCVLRTSRATDPRWAGVRYGYSWRYCNYRRSGA